MKRILTRALLNINGQKVDKLLKEQKSNTSSLFKITLYALNLFIQQIYFA